MHPAWEHIRGLAEDPDRSAGPADRGREAERASRPPASRSMRPAAVVRTRGSPGSSLRIATSLPGVEVETDVGTWQVHETPGHAPSHVTLHEPESGMVISGDHLLGRVSIFFDYGHTPDVVNIWIYAYAIEILAGTLVQLAIPAWDLRNSPFKFSLSFAWRNPGVRRVLLLMLPVTISLGLINFNLLINSLFGSLVSDEAPAAIDKAFRIYQLPQGIFSVAIATVLFPTLARFASRGEHDNLRATMANGMRQILFILVPAAAAILVLSEPMIRLVFQRGEFGPAETTLVATALFWFAFSLPTNGLFLLLTRTFFSLQRPWVPTAIAAGNLAVTALARARPLPPRRRRDRRRDRDRDDRQRRRPVRRSCAASSTASSSTSLLSSGDPDRARRRRARRGQLRRLGRARQRPRPRALRPDRLAGRRPRPRRPRPTWARQSSCASPSSSRSSASCAAARCSTSARYLLGVARDPSPSSASPGSGLPPSGGASSPTSRALRPTSQPSSSPLALLIWAAELAGHLRRLRSHCHICCGRGAGVGTWTLLPAGGAGQGGRGRLCARRPPSSTGPAGRSVDVATLIALVIAALAVVHFADGVRLRLDTGMTGFDCTWYHGPFAAGFFQSGDTWGLHYIAPQFLAWFYPANSEIFHAVGMNAFDRDILSPLLNLGWFVGCLLACWCIGGPPGRALVTGPRSGRAQRAGALRPGGRGAQRPRRHLLPARRDRDRPQRRAPGRAGEQGGPLSTGALALVGLAAGLAAGTKLNFLLPARSSSSGSPRSRRGGGGAPWAAAGWGRWPAVATGTCATSSTQATRCPGSTTSARSRCRLPTRRSAAAKPTASSATSPTARSGRTGSCPASTMGSGSLWPLLLAAALAGLCSPRPRARSVGAGCDPVLPSRPVGRSPPSPGWSLRPRPPAPRACPTASSPASATSRPALVLGLALLPTALTCDRGSSGCSAGRWASEPAGVDSAALVGRPGGEGLAPGAARSPSLAVAIGYPVQRHYLRDRYADPTLHHARPRRRIQMGDAVSGARIATTSTRQYPLFGTDLSNRVEFVGEERPHGGFVAPADLPRLAPPARPRALRLRRRQPRPGRAWRARLSALRPLDRWPGRDGGPARAADGRLPSRLDRSPPGSLGRRATARSWDARGPHDDSSSAKL